MSAVGTAVIEMESVEKSFATRRARPVLALDRVSFQVEPRQFVCLVGPSGCGKSTLLRLVGGLTPPTAGSIKVGGEQVSAARPHIAFVFQRSLLLEWMSVLDNVLLPATIEGTRTPQRLQRANELLELVGIADFANHLPSHLSGGMQQRVAIARALLRDPAILLLDEPFGSLDALTREQMNLELMKIWSLAGREKTVLMVTHDITEAVFMSDRVLVMSRRPGRILADLEVPLPRPRTLDMVYQPAFGKIVAEARGRLSSDETRSV